MAVSIRRQILSQLRRFGLPTSQPSVLRLLAPSDASSFAGLGGTYAVDLPNETGDTLIKDSLIKDLRNASSPFIDQVEACKIEANRLLLQVNFDYFVKGLFADLSRPQTSVAAQLDEAEGGTAKKETIIVEYSSPNIAKPFHVGNLRSAIIGNCVANVLAFKGHKVIRMNYLGDWGTQFGILSLAYDKFGNEESLQAEPLKHLFEVYVKGNQEIEHNADWRQAAKDRFTQLETESDARIREQWSRFRTLSLEELTRLYSRLGMVFDVIESESMYCRASRDIVDTLKASGLLETSPDGAVLAVTPSLDNTKETLRVPLLKSDGSTLYLTRDIAAALHRKAVYAFDRLVYVVDSSQGKHFRGLRSILASMGSPVAGQMEHLKFGRILGMSTRRGDTIFLDDVLNQAKEEALAAIRASPNTKISPEQYETVADQLGVSAIIVHDLANRRVREYRFNWNKALRLNGDTGISLQYTHARLCSLEKNCGLPFNPEAEVMVSAVDTAEGRQLINRLAMFEQVVSLTADEMEPSVLARYLFDLKGAINRANQVLPIKGTDEPVAQTRLRLFRCAQNVLAQSMRLLGLQPLQAM